jgi:hypothetical protein
MAKSRISIIAHFASLGLFIIKENYIMGHVTCKEDIIKAYIILVGKI